MRTTNKCRRRAKALVATLIVAMVPVNEPGVLQAVGCDGDAKLCDFRIETVAAPKRIQLIPDTPQIAGDGKDICHIEFRVDGPAQIIGIENGRADGHVDYKDLTHEAFNGRGLAILQSSRGRGEVTLKASAAGLEPAEITLRVR